MEWNDEGIVLSARRHGESAAIVTLLTPAHGRHAGLVRGGAGRRQRGVLQPGNRVAARWRARLSEHLGTLTCELTEALVAPLLGDPLRLAGLSAACALADWALPEREPHAVIHDGLVHLIKALSGDDWPPLYVTWEMDLLRELGFGLDLESCAATGRTDTLAFVSPRTGRAVSLSAGEPYRDRLLVLPPFLTGAAVAATPRDIVDGLTLSAHFLERHVLAAAGRRLPAARLRLADRVAANVDD
ncbi:MAG: DNA repair protein RecO [Rhodospirillales bacterium]|jgi:DNA repair protein RecO (recombination protein O)|nr:DNA repair protein RecO [Rhodospirillales bacterium]